MDEPLNDVALRILGCLIEKERTTPEYYPLTLNALTNACNQKSNRHPVVAVDDTTVVRGLEQLRDRGYAVKVHRADSRTPKYEHRLGDRQGLSGAEIAVLAELMLRGPQTPGELRARAGRLHAFDTREAVEAILAALADRPDPLVLKLPRQAGQKECRYAHRLGKMPEAPAEEDPAPRPPEAATLAVQAEDRRLAALEESVAALREDLRGLRDDFDRFRKAFED